MYKNHAGVDVFARGGYEIDVWAPDMEKTCFFENLYRRPELFRRQHLQVRARVMFSCICTCKCTYLRVRTIKYKRAYMCVCTNIYQIFGRQRLALPGRSTRIWPKCISIQMCACVCTKIYMCIYQCTCVYSQMHICVYTMYICVYQICILCCMCTQMYLCVFWFERQSFSHPGQDIYIQIYVAYSPRRMPACVCACVCMYKCIANGRTA